MPASGRRGFGFRKRRPAAAPASITALTIVTPPVISGTTTNDGSSLTVTTPAVWSAGSGFTRVYQWYRDASLISGAIGSSYAKQGADAGANITVKEQANNGALSIASASNAIGPIGALVDVTAPTLSSPTSAQTGSTTATLGVTTNEANGTLYHVVTTSATPPTAVQVEAGQNNAGTAAVASGNQAIGSTGAKTANITGLTASTLYYGYWMHKDAAGNRSAVSSTASFTTAASSFTETPPTLTLVDDDPLEWTIVTGSAIAGDTLRMHWTKNGAAQTAVDEVLDDGELIDGNPAFPATDFVGAVVGDAITVYVTIRRGGVQVSDVSNTLSWTWADPTPAPAWSSSTTASVAENATLSYTMAASDTSSYSIVGGADQARFETSGTTLRWASNGTKDYETPNDSDTNNTYVVNLRATGPTGKTTDRTVTVTVTNVAEGGTVGLATSTGADKSGSLTVSGTPALTFTGTGSGNWCAARLTANPVTSKVHAEVTITNFNGATMQLSVDNDTVNLNTANGGSNFPGRFDNDGCGIEIGTWGSGVWSANTGDYGNGAASPANGYVLAIEYDKATGQVKFFNASTGVQVGNTKTVTLGTGTIVVGWTGGTTPVATLNLIAPFVMTPTSGYGSYE